MHGDAIPLGIVIGERGMHLHLVLTDLGAIVDGFADEIGAGEGSHNVAKLKENIALDILRPVFVQFDRIGRHRRMSGVIGR